MEVKNINIKPVWTAVALFALLTLCGCETYNLPQGVNITESGDIVEINIDTTVWSQERSSVHVDLDWVQLELVTVNGRIKARYGFERFLRQEVVVRYLDEEGKAVREYAAASTKLETPTPEKE